MLVVDFSLLVSCTCHINFVSDSTVYKFKLHIPKSIGIVMTGIVLLAVGVTVLTFGKLHAFNIT